VKILLLTRLRDWVPNSLPCCKLAGLVAGSGGSSAGLISRWHRAASGKVPNEQWPIAFRKQSRLQLHMRIAMIVLNVYRHWEVVELVSKSRSSRSKTLFRPSANAYEVNQTNTSSYSWRVCPWRNDSHTTTRVAQSTLYICSLRK
jgi:hypothetical protein